MKQIASAAILMVLTMALLVSPVFAWGPKAHEAIAIQVAKQVRPSNYSAFYAGAVLPDMFLAMNTGNTVKHRILHSDEYFQRLKALAVTNELKSFVMGYQTHLVSDKVEAEYSASIGSGNVDIGVDKLLKRSSVRVYISQNVANLMVKAWTYDKSLYAWWIRYSATIFNMYLSGRYYIPGGEGDFSDYKPWFDRSVQESIKAIKGNN